VPVVGFVDAITGTTENLERELKSQLYQLQTAQAENYHLKASIGRINGILAGARGQQISLLAIIKGWDTLNAEFTELINSEDISTELSLWIQNELTTTHRDWIDLRNQVNSF